MNLQELISKKDRIVAGVMSGTSLDGVDVCVAKISGTGQEADIEVIAFESLSYSAELRASILAQSEVESSDVSSISGLNVRLAHEYARQIETLIKREGIELDLVGCHGQTIHHLPNSTTIAGEDVRSTLQIGDHSVLSNLIGIPVVGNFRAADMAVGGQGAPLVNYLDWVYFSDEEKGRIVLNMGGIANITILKAGGKLEEVVAFDTGPANMPIDLLVARHFDLVYDEGGQVAKSGSEISGYVEKWVAEDYIQKAPPKSTGREEYGEVFVSRIMADEDFSSRAPADQVRTVSEFVARSIAENIRNEVRPLENYKALIAAGGGVHNDFIMQRLEDQLPELAVSTTRSFGLDPDARESLCFALFAHEFLNGAPSNCVSATGASRPAVLGTLAIP